MTIGNNVKMQKSSKDIRHSFHSDKQQSFESQFTHAMVQSFLFPFRFGNPEILWNIP